MCGREEGSRDMKSSGTEGEREKKKDASRRSGFVSATWRVGESSELTIQPTDVITPPH